MRVCAKRMGQLFYGTGADVRGERAAHIWQPILVSHDNDVRQPPPSHTTATISSAKCHSNSNDNDNNINNNWEQGIGDWRSFGPLCGGCSVMTNRLVTIVSSSISLEQRQTKMFQSLKQHPQQQQQQQITLTDHAKGSKQKVERKTKH